jgi:heme-degrading monooxygenase HmoA
MFARLSTLQGSPESIEAGIAAVRDQVFPGAKELDGFRGMIALSDRSTGKMIGITLWDTEEAMRASEQAAEGMRQVSADAGAAQIASVERFEVVFDERV